MPEGRLRAGAVRQPARVLGVTPECQASVAWSCWEPGIEGHTRQGAPEHLVAGSTSHCDLPWTA